MAIPVFPARYAFPKGSVAVNSTSRLFSRFRAERSPFPRVGSTTVPRYQPEDAFGATIVLLRDCKTLLREWAHQTAEAHVSDGVESAQTP